MPFRKLAVVSTVATFLLIGIGGLVRATKSGLGCGEDWPACNGELIPSMQTYTTAIEWSHRFVALAVVVLLGGLVLVAFRSRAEQPRLLAASVAAFGLVIVQALVGMIVVKLRLEAASVVVHLGLALALAGLLIHVSVLAARAEGALASAGNRGVTSRAWVAATAVLVLLLVGSYVRGIQAGSTFPDWPLMNGEVVPDLSSTAHAMTFLHRVLAILAGATVLYSAVDVIKRKEELRVAARLAHAALGLFAIEILLGAVNVWTGVDVPWVRTLHLFTGVVIWGCLVGIAAVSSRATVSRVERGPTSARIAFEGEG
jgi:heme a synthase